MDKTQVTALVGSVIAWLLGRAYNWLTTRTSDNTASWERWAVKAVNTITSLYPDLTPDVAADKALAELRDILGRLRIKPSTSQWNHLTEVVHETILAWQLSRLGPETTKVANIFDGTRS